MIENRRQFTRVLFSVDATLSIADRTYVVSIQDISLNGVLVLTSDVLPDLTDQTGNFVMSLAENETEIAMEIKVIHQKNNELGLMSQFIDIESISNLKRLVELNLGDDEQLNRELSQLSRE